MYSAFEKYLRSLMLNSWFYMNLIAVYFQMQIFAVTSTEGCFFVRSRLRACSLFEMRLKCRASYVEMCRFAVNVSKLRIINCSDGCFVDRQISK